MRKKISVAVVGCGYWGPNLMRNFCENVQCQLAWLVDLDKTRLDRYASRYPQVKTATRLQDALADPALDAVAIATPISTHYPLVKQCLNAGKHVLVEKPMAQTAAECGELIELARKQKVTLMVDHTFIYTGAVRKIKELIDTDVLGDLYYFDSVRVNLGLFQHDVNVIWDLAPHDISIMDFVLNKRPTHVAAHGACHLPGSNIENIAYLTLKFQDGTIAHFHVNWLAPAKIRRIIIGGSKKMLVYDDLDPDEKIKIYDRGVELQEPKDTVSRKLLTSYRTGDLHVPKVDRTEALSTEIDHFTECIHTGRKPESDGEAGMRIVNILVAAQKSLVQNGVFIPL